MHSCASTGPWGEKWGVDGWVPGPSGTGEPLSGLRLSCGPPAWRFGVDGLVCFTTGCFQVAYCRLADERS